jgi:ketosteroid isomerase-like protein
VIVEIFRIVDGRIAELWGVGSLPGSVASSPREVVDELLRRTAPGPAEDMADLFAEDAVFELPYLPPGTPQPAPGREVFRGHLRSAVGVQEFDGVDDVHHYEATDSEVVVTEYLLHGHVVATGRRFTSRVVMVNRVRHGLIVWSRSYSNPLDSAIAFDMVDRLLGGLSAS